MNLRDCLSNYQLISPVGSGTYGVVYKAVHKPSQSIVALKQLKADPSDDGVPTTAIREISLLKHLNHKNIVKLHSIISEDDQLHIVMEFVEYTVKGIIDQSKNGLARSLIASLMHQLLRGLAFCHSQKIMHRDIKPQNLLVHQNGELKIGDFGLARSYSIPVRAFSHEVVTLWYRAPEVLWGSRKYSSAIDIWSSGCTFAEMISGSPLFTGRNDRDQLTKIFRVLGTPTPELWPDIVDLPDFNLAECPAFPRQNLNEMFGSIGEEGVDLLARMLEYDPAKRISARDALNHPFFHVKK